MDIVDRIFALLEQNKMEQKAFAAEIGVAPSKVSEWKKRKSTSYNRRLPEIARALHTSVEYLLNGQEKPAPITESGLDATKYHMLNEENRALVDQMIEKLLKSQSGE